MSLDDCILRIEGVNKSFGPTHANKNISISLKKGEVRGLAGENGSGKSTLMSILAGIQKKDSGQMYKSGELYDPASPVEANDRKIGIVVQELGLVNNLPVGVNIFLGRTGKFSKYGAVDLPKLYEAAKEQLRKWNLGDIPVKSTAEGLSVESKKLVELARALSIDPDILILDEVTAALSQDKRIILYDIISDFKKRGKSVVIIAHDLDEIINLTDSITILRDGEVIDTRQSSELTPDILKRLMVGREINGAYYRADNEENYDPEVVLEVKNVSVSNDLDDVSFELHKGEILGVCGLSDSGIHTLGKAVFGSAKLNEGSVFFKKKDTEIKNPSQAIKKGFAYVPKDRDLEALMLNASIKDNMCLPSIKDIEGFLGFISPARLKEVSGKAVRDFEVKTTGISQFIGRLSGGNKQKVNLARWMIRDIDVLILDCPTRGVDVGVKSYIYGILNKAKQNGLSIILISDELPEVIGMSDRILVMKNGKTVGIFNRSSQFTEESIIEVMI
jgi:ribose transport system ATP-binding protein